MRYNHSRRHCQGSGRPGPGYRFNRSQGRPGPGIFSAGQDVYRSRSGILLGVCRGLAERFHFNVFWTRVIVIILFLCTGFWPVGVLYIAAGLLLRPEPAIPLENEVDEEFYRTYTSSRASALQRIKQKFDNLDRRVQRMEDTVTSREFDL